jgi:hypothetical protein
MAQRVIYTQAEAGSIDAMAEDMNATADLRGWEEGDYLWTNSLESKERVLDVSMDVATDEHFVRLMERHGLYAVDVYSTNWKGVQA